VDQRGAASITRRSRRHQVRDVPSPGQVPWAIPFHASDRTWSARGAESTSGGSASPCRCSCLMWSTVAARAALLLLHCVPLSSCASRRSISIRSATVSVKISCASCLPTDRGRTIDTSPAVVLGENQSGGILLHAHKKVTRRFL
jgi:hypothetical protein